MKKLSFNPISLEEYLVFNVDSRRKAFRLIKSKGYNRPKDEKQMMRVLAEIRRNGDEEDLITLAKIHPDYDLIKYAVIQEMEADEAESETSNACGSGYSNCGGCGGHSAASGISGIEQMMGIGGNYKSSGVIGDSFDGTWINAGGRMYPANGNTTIIPTENKDDDKKFYMTLFGSTALVGLILIGLKSIGQGKAA